MSVQRRSIGYAIAAAALYAMSAPLSKQLLASVSATMMAALLYLGAGLGMCAVRLGQRALNTPRREQSLARADLPYVAGMVALDIAAPIFLMLGLSRTTAANASLLNNFEIVATSIIALFVFGEAISRRLWAAIGLITLASILLSVEGTESLSFSAGSLLVLLACVCWGFENNCTRRLSEKDPLEIVTVKGLGQYRTNELVRRRKHFLSDAIADFEGLLEVNRKICKQQMAEKASPTLPTNCAVLPYAPGWGRWALPWPREAGFPGYGRLSRRCCLALWLMG